MAISALNTFLRTIDKTIRHGIARYIGNITSTTATGTTDISAAGDYTINFDRTFKAAPRVVSCSLQTSTAGAAGTYPCVWVKTVTTSTAIVALGGAVGTLADARIILVVEGEV